MGGYLHVLGQLGVSSLLAWLLAASHIAYTFQEGTCDRLGLFARGGARPQGVEALPQQLLVALGLLLVVLEDTPNLGVFGGRNHRVQRSEEHTSELQSRQYLVCRLLLEKKKRNE